MIVNWVELGYRQFPWEQKFVKIAVVATSSKAGNYLIKRLNEDSVASTEKSCISDFLKDLDQVVGEIAAANGGSLDLNKLLLTFPDRGTTIRTSKYFSLEASSLEEALAQVDTGSTFISSQSWNGDDVPEEFVTNLAKEAIRSGDHDALTNLDDHVALRASFKTHLLENGLWIDSNS